MSLILENRGGIQAALNTSRLNMDFTLKGSISTCNDQLFILIPWCMLGLLRDSLRCLRGHDTNGHTRLHYASGSTARVAPSRHGHRSGMSAPASLRLEPVRRNRLDG